jgi:hypothetical protein
MSTETHHPIDDDDDNDVEEDGRSEEHLRRKSGNTSSLQKKKGVKCMLKLKEKCLNRAATKSKRRPTKNSGLPPKEGLVTVKDPGLEETVKLMEQMKFDDMMELRERLFCNLLPGKTVEL